MLCVVWQQTCDLNEQEFAKANESARLQRADLEARKDELTNLISKVSATEAMVERVPQSIETFEEAFQSLEPRRQQAQLQTILKASNVYKNGKIDLEFREQIFNKDRSAGFIESQRWHNNTFMFVDHIESRTPSCPADLNLVK